jgi:hypothetical protein
MYCTIDVSVELQFQFHTLFKENADVLAYLSCVVGHHFVDMNILLRWHRLQPL